jgi:hypothetical protein
MSHDDDWRGILRGVCFLVDASFHLTLELTIFRMVNQPQPIYYIKYVIGA